jgi:hypothetical protein
MTRTLILFALWMARPAVAEELRLPLVIHIVRRGSVVEAASLERFVGEINQVYAQAGICFSLEEPRIVDRSADLRTYRERHAFAPFAVAGAVNVFLVHSIFDPESSESTVREAARFGFVPDQWLDGAHIEPKGSRTSYALVSVDPAAVRATALTIAHEIGHILGLGHSPVADNIMGYAAEPTRFDADQIRDLRARARREVASGGLHLARACGAGTP